ncbi:unnamed protein product [Phytophthora fragariaefolia]|uniref:Unnamed protein product n=1 Tax=Phytophthora fragariaefolia TaxID=1490495 RepID=A0A9W6TKT7_9STRA|nr:unnamed protein product [Phytophthora fragariaefolia]
MWRIDRQMTIRRGATTLTRTTLTSMIVMSRPPTSMNAEPRQSGRTARLRAAAVVETSLTEDSTVTHATKARTDVTVNMDRVRRAEELTTLHNTATSVINCPYHEQRFKLGSPSTETGLVPIGLPQLASPLVDCGYAFVCESKWLKTRRREEANEVKTMEIEKERNGSFGGGEIDERKYDEWNGGTSEGLISRITQKPRRDYQLENGIKLLSGERLGWWSAQKFDKRVRMRALVQGAANDARTRILLDTGANVSVISERFDKQLRLREVRDHGRCVLWVIDDGAGVDVVLGMDFMIPTGVRLDLFHATARLPDEVEIPLIKTQRMADTRKEGPHVPDGHTEVLTIPWHESRNNRPMRQPPTNETHELWVRRTKELIPKVVEFLRGRARRVRVTNISDRLVTCPVHLPLLMWVPRGSLPRTEGYVRLGSDKYNEWRVLAYSRSRDSNLYKDEGEIYQRWLAAQPSAVERVSYTTPTKILRRPSDSSEGELHPKPTERSDLVSESSESSQLKLEGAYLAAATVSKDWGDHDTLNAPEHLGYDIEFDDYAHELAFVLNLTEAASTTLDYTGTHVRHPTLSGEQQDRVVKVLKSHVRIMISSGNTLPTPAYGVLCDIDVQEHPPIIHKARRKNGVGIRLCIDYKMVNSVTAIMEYAIPLAHRHEEISVVLLPRCCQWILGIDDDSESSEDPQGGWSAFAERVQKAEAVETAVSGSTTDTATLGRTRFEADRENTDTPDFSSAVVNNPRDGMFASGEAGQSSLVPVFERRSFVDDICFSGESFDCCLETLDRLLSSLEECRISVSFTKIMSVQPTVDFLSHAVSREGLRADAKKLKATTEHSFPKTTKEVQTFLGTLNYYSRFIADFAVYGAAFYQVRKEDVGSSGDLSTAKRSFAAPQAKVADAPILKHFDRAKEVYVMLFANDWALSTTLMQKHDDVMHPVRFCGRVFKDNEVNYHPAENEVLALLLLLNTCYTRLAGRTINAYTTFSTLGWINTSKTLFGRSIQFCTLRTFHPICGHVVSVAPSGPPSRGRRQCVQPSREVTQVNTPRPRSEGVTTQYDIFFDFALKPRFVTAITRQQAHTSKKRVILAETPDEDSEASPVEPVPPDQLNDATTETSHSENDAISLGAAERPSSAEYVDP